MCPLPSQPGVGHLGHTLTHQCTAFKDLIILTKTAVPSTLNGVLVQVSQDEQKHNRLLVVWRLKTVNYIQDIRGSLCRIMDHLNSKQASAPLSRSGLLQTPSEWCFYINLIHLSSLPVNRLHGNERWNYVLKGGILTVVTYTRISFLLSLGWNLTLKLVVVTSPGYFLSSRFSWSSSSPSEEVYEGAVYSTYRKVNSSGACR